MKPADPSPARRRLFLRQQEVCNCASVCEIINRSKLGNHVKVSFVFVLVLGFGLGIIRRREISGFRFGVVDGRSLLPFCAASVETWLPTFRDNL